MNYYWVRVKGVLMIGTPEDNAFRVFTRDGSYVTEATPEEKL